MMPPLSGGGIITPSDDMVVLLCALLEAIGHPTALEAVALTVPGEFEHVFALTRGGGQGDWIALDPTENVPVGWRPPGILSSIVWMNGS